MMRHDIEPAKIVYLELFAGCDMACPMCVTLPYRDGHRTHLSRAAIRDRILGPCAARGMRHVIFAGGEPTLRRDFLDIIDDAAALGYRIWVATNLLRFDDEKLTALLARLDHGGHSLQISFDSIVPDEMNQIRGGNVFAAVDHNCRRIIALRHALGTNVQIGASLTVQQENIESVQASIDYVLDDLGFDFIIVSPRHDYKAVTPENFLAQRPSDWCRNNERALIQLGLQLYLRARRDARIRLRGNVDDWVNFIRSPHQMRRPCGAGEFLFFNAEGEARGCMMGLPYANAAISEIDTILASDAYHAARQFLNTCRICHFGCN